MDGIRGTKRNETVPWMMRLEIKRTMKMQLSCWLYLTRNANAYFPHNYFYRKKIDGATNITTINRKTAKMHVIFLIDVMQKRKLTFLGARARNFLEVSLIICNFHISIKILSYNSLITTDWNAINQNLIEKCKIIKHWVMCNLIFLKAL